MSAHTPGPWIVERDGAMLEVCNAETLFTVARVFKHEQNARLIAAAPQLLEALIEAENALADYVPTIEKTGASLNYGHAVIRRARAAIAAAKGQT